MNWIMRVCLCSLVLFLSACQSGAAQQPMDPAAVMEAYTAAINNHDVERALAFVADDAVYHRPTGEFRGKAQIRTFIEDLVARNVRVEVVGERRVEGERVMWESRVFLNDPNNPNGPQLEIRNASESIVRDGKIVSHTAKRAP